MSRAPNYEFQEWWNKQREKTNNVDPLNDPKLDHSHSTTPPPFTALDVDSSSSSVAARKERSRSARQLSWVCLLKFQQLAASLGWLSGGIFHLARTAHRRIVDSASLRGDTSRLYRAIRVFLVVVIVLLGFELVAYFKGWHFRRPDPSDVLGLLAVVYATWVDVRARYMSPPLQSLANLCTVLFIVQSVDRVVLILGCFWIKFRRLKPLASVDYDVGDHSVEDFPMVLVQIPMCNEREVYQQSIGAVCIMDWPKERMLVQVLDDSDEVDTQQLIKAEVHKWQQRGVRIIYRHRLIRTGYKAGNLKSAMGCDYVKDYEFVAIFDADFQPTPDFLKKTVPYFKCWIHVYINQWAG